MPRQLVMPPMKVLLASVVQLVLRVRECRCPTRIGYSWCLQVKQQPWHHADLSALSGEEPPSENLHGTLQVLLLLLLSRLLLHSSLEDVCR
jgi:hypothetical protein